MNKASTLNLSRTLRPPLVVLLIALFIQLEAGAQNSGPFQQVFSFPLPQNAHPGPLVQGQDGNLYGTTAARYGTIYRLTPTGVLTTLFAFGMTNGVEPNALIRARDGNLYGTTRGGGAFGNSREEGGTIFSLSLSGTLVTLISFSGTNGWAPQFLLEGKDGNFYGATAGSPVSGLGRTIFKMTPQGSLTTLTSLDVIEGNQVLAFVSGQDGNIYGTTSRSGANGRGEIFKLDTSGMIQSMASFDGVLWGSNGATLAQGDDGFLYGTVWYGPPPDPLEPSQGTFFKVSAEGTLKPLASFSFPTGKLPDAILKANDGSFYGTTRAGGRGTGTIFKLSSSGAITQLADFSEINSSGWSGTCLAQGLDGQVYGTTYDGGAGGYGTVFSIRADGNVQKLRDLSGAGEEELPSLFPLLSDQLGNFHGIRHDGALGKGAFWVDITNSGTLTNAVSLNSLSNSLPETLVEHSSGDFYGTSREGGASRIGAIIRITRSGAAAVLASLHDEYYGAYPNGPLIEDRTGNLLGITQGGGAHNNGTVFSISPTGTLTVLAAFEFDGANFVNPQGPLVLAADGTLFGTTRWGGPQRRGTVFALSPSGQLTTLVSFDETNGDEPNHLMKGVDGSLYGTTLGGLFKLTPEGKVTHYALPGFGFTRWPFIQGGDGFLYGLIGTYGFDYWGVRTTGIFRVSPFGESTLLYSFPFDGFSGARVRRADQLLRGADGRIYATTIGGTLDAGGIIQLLVPPSLTSLGRANETTHVTWAGFPGQRYQVQVATDLSAPNWANLNEPLTATNSSTTVIDTNSSPQRFYRVELAP